MEQYSDQSHESYRLFISAEPNSNPHLNFLPQGVLESSIKITNEPPTGMLANLHMALDNFTQETLEMCSKEAEFKVKQAIDLYITRFLLDCKIIIA